MNLQFSYKKNTKTFLSNSIQNNNESSSEKSCKQQNELDKLRTSTNLSKSYFNRREEYTNQKVLGCNFEKCT